MEINKFIPLASPDINQQDIDCVTEVLRSGMLVQGANVLALEKSFNEFNKSKNAIAVSNGTATLHLALLALGIGKGDEVIVPAFSYVATANVVEMVGATCVFVDIDINTFNIDVTKIEALITTKTKAIIPVHEFGLACDIETVMQIASKHKLLVIEDAACALGAMQNGKHTGTFGELGSFSLHPRKSITSGEGGVLLTANDELAKKLRQLRNHGIEMVDGKMNFVGAGLNYRMTDFQAALANSQMQRLDQVIACKQELAEVYFNEIKNEAVVLPSVPSDRNHTWQTFHILIGDNKNQSEVLAVLKENNIGANYGAQCIPATEYYKTKYQLDAAEQFPHAYRAYTKGIAIPIYEKLTKEIIKQIANSINRL
ncbi:MAG: DegT/DnrJ/EryC1/StrS family aminotransferase [Ferruginibacter sp.]|nr:DegT/DnrJ/EryC1/StrS family aminotransferase [Ferruginibacter sp.]